MITRGKEGTWNLFVTPYLNNGCYCNTWTITH